MKLKLISCIVFIALGVAVVAMLLGNHAEQEGLYKKYLAKARESAEKEIPYIAVQNYQSAFSIHCDDEEIYKEYITQSEILGKSFYSSALNNYVKYFPESAEAYEKLCKYMYEQENYRKVITIALEAREKGVATDEIKKLYNICFCMLDTINGGFEEAQSFSNGYARVKVDEKYGYISKTGSFLISPIYDAASMMTSSGAAVFDGTRWQMVNTKGYVVARPDVEIDSLSFLSSGKIRVSKDGKYGYVTSSMSVKELPYDYASNFRKGIAAVKKDDKWALINIDEELITEYVFEDVLLDEYETCVAESIVFVKQNGKFYMVRTNGEKVCETGFDDAYPFVSKQPAAVCVSGKWGFVNEEGNIVIEPQYEKAKSFSKNYGAVCKDGAWGYISTNGEWRIENQYEDCKPFMESGIAAVKVNGLWKYVQLLGYRN